jgi:hypothetical protein
MNTQVRSAKMTDEQKVMRDNLLFSLFDCIEVLEAEPLDEKDPAVLSERQRGLVALKWIRGEMKKDEMRYNISVSRFFQVKEAKALLKLDGLEFASQFFDQPLSTLRMQCKRAGEPLPAALALLYEKYNERRGKGPAPVVNHDPLSWMFTGAPRSEKKSAAQHQA